MTQELLNEMTPMGGGVYLAEFEGPKQQYLRRAFNAQVKQSPDQWGEYAPVCKDLMRIWEDGNSMKRVVVVDLRPARKFKKIDIPKQFMGWALGAEGAKVKLIEGILGHRILFNQVEHSGKMV